MCNLMSNYLSKVVLLLLLCFQTGYTAAQNTSKPFNELQEDAIAQLLEHIGIAGAIDQVDKIILQTLASSDFTAANQSAEQLNLEKLMAASSGDLVLAATTAYVAQNNPLSPEQINALLDNELASRVRNFDVSLEMDKAFEKYEAYQHKLSQNPVEESRIELMQRIDTALQGSVIAALLQTELEKTMTAIQARMAGRSSALAAQQYGEKRQELRQQHMASIAVQLHIFSYRFMKDQELQAYVEWLEADDVQTVLAVCVAGLQQALRANRAMALQQVKPAM